MDIEGIIKGAVKEAINEAFIKEANRVEQAIQRMEKKIEEADPEKVEKLDESLKELPLDELAAYQNAKSIAQMEEKITLDEAMIIYNILNRWGTSTLAQRVAVTQVMGELLKVVSEKNERDLEESVEVIQKFITSEMTSGDIVNQVEGKAQFLIKKLKSRARSRGFTEDFGQKELRQFEDYVWGIRAESDLSSYDETRIAEICIKVRDIIETMDMDSIASFDQIDEEDYQVEQHVAEEAEKIRDAVTTRWDAIVDDVYMGNLNRTEGWNEIQEFLFKEYPDVNLDVIGRLELEYKRETVDVDMHSRGEDDASLM